MIDARTAPYGALVLRVALGAMWIAHGLMKVFVFTPAGFGGFLGSLGYPALLAWPVILAEVVGGALIVAGLWGRAVSLALVPVMIAAMLVHVPNGWSFSAAGGGWEYPAFLIAASIAHALIGDGAHALARDPVAARRGTLVAAE